MPDLDDALLHCYREALYRVHAPAGDIDLRVDRYSAELDDLMRACGARTAAFISACNPRSEIREPAWNTQAARRLSAAVAALGLRTLTGVGLDEDGRWPGEQSLLALDISREQAITLGRRFGQHAIIWIRADARPELLICGEDADVR